MAVNAVASRAVAFLALAVVLAPTACRPSAPRAAHDPIVLVVIDTLRRDHLSVFGGTARTPNLAALAERGVTRPSLASFHQTSMSMGALFTGRTPSLESAGGNGDAPLAWRPAAWCGMGRFAQDAQSDACLPPGVPTLGERIAQRGYLTVGVVANALLHEPAGFARGFARWVEVGPAGSGAEAGRARARIAARARSYEHVHEALVAVLDDLPDDAPLFVYLHYLDVHDWLHLGRSYAESVERMDRGIGELLRILEARDLLADAAILVTSDHGELIEDRERVLPHHPLHLGNPSYRDVLDVPFILAGAPEAALPPLVRSEDVHRILLALAGAPAPPDASVLASDELLVSEKLFRTYQQGRFKSLWRRGGRHVLVDLERDPGETRDVAAEHPDVVRRHRERIAELGEALAAEGLPTEPADPEAGSGPAGGDGGAPPLDPRWVERLRSMGYLE